MSNSMNNETIRLKEAREGKAAWKKWGPYLSERQWGTVREDYSEDGTPGITLLTTRPAHGYTNGEKTAWQAFPMRSSIFAFPLHSGWDQ